MLLLFAVAFIVRSILNLHFRVAPTVMIDESLYPNIARSLAWQGQLNYRGQPVNYPYILYPLLLVPVYWLQHFINQGDIYQYVMVFNALLMCSSVIPAYLLATDFSRDERKGFAAAVVTALIPDMVLSAYEMTECLVWPLSLWMVYFAWRFFSEKEQRWGVLTAVFTGLLFFTKPGAIAVGAAILVFCLLLALYEKDRRALKKTLVSLGVLLLCVLLVYAIYVFVFGNAFSLLGLYEKQTSDWEPSHLLIAIEGFFMMVLLFAFACGGLFLFLPYCCFRDYSKAQQRMIAGVTFGLLVAIAGTAFFVIPYKWAGSFTSFKVHLRYVAMYVPVWYILSLPCERKKGQIGKGLIIALVVFAVLCVWPGVRVGFPANTSTSADSITLSGFNISGHLDGNILGWFETAAMLIFVVLLFFCFTEGYSGKVAILSTCVLCAFFLFNDGCAYTNAVFNLKDHFTEEALELNDVLNELDETPLGVIAGDYDEAHTYLQESHFNKPMEQITYNQLCYSMDQTDGVYVPFVPTRQTPNYNNHETVDTTTIILGHGLDSLVELSDTTTSQSTTYGYYTVVHITEGERWLDSFLYNTDAGVIADGENASLYCLDPARGEDDTLSITMSVTADTAGGSLILVAGSKSYTVTLSVTEPTVIELNVPYGRITSLKASGANITINGYSTR